MNGSASQIWVYKSQQNWSYVLWADFQYQRPLAARDVYWNLGRVHGDINPLRGHSDKSMLSAENTETIVFLT